MIPRHRSGPLETRHIELPGFSLRRYRVYRPPDISDGRPRPILVLFDGQNVFDDEGSFSGGWHADLAIERLARTRLRPILVGLDHGGEQRINELSPFPNRFGNGRADAFLRGIAHQLMPALRREFLIIEGPVGVLLGGSSMGGLASLYGHLRFPESFGGALSMSPSLGVGGQALFDFIQETHRPSISRIYLDTGAREGGARLEELGRILRARHYDADHLLVRVDKRGQHNERSWRRRLPAALRFFYRADTDRQRPVAFQYPARDSLPTGSPGR